MICASNQISSGQYQCFRPHKNVGMVGFALLILSGCVVVPLPTAVKHNEIDSFELQELKGKSRTQVIAQLGEPTYKIVWSEKGESYFLYEGRTDYGFAVAHVKFLGPGNYGYNEYNVTSETLCYLVVFNFDARVVRTSAQNGSDTYCPTQIWPEHDFKKLLKAMGSEGDPDAPLILARKFNDLTLSTPTKFVRISPE